MVFNFCRWKSAQVKLCIIFFFSKNSNVVGSELSSFSPKTYLKLANITISPEINKRVIASLHYVKTP